MEGADQYIRDLKNIETHLLDTGHFALETDGEEIASQIENFFMKEQRKAAHNKENASCLQSQRKTERRFTTRTGERANP
jgi:tRNA G46 methylase TrmB